MTRSAVDVSSPRRDQRDLGRLLAGKASGDEIALRKLAPDQEVPDDIVGFHAQQAVEKLLKAALAMSGRPPPRTHDLSRLVALLEEAGLDPPAEGRAARRLAPWAVEFRYDDVLAERLDRDEAQALVAAVRRWVDELLAGFEPPASASDSGDAVR